MDTIERCGFEEHYRGECRGRLMRVTHAFIGPASGERYEGASGVYCEAHTGQMVAHLLAHPESELTGVELVQAAKGGGVMATRFGFHAIGMSDSVSGAIDAADAPAAARAGAMRYAETIGTPIPERGPIERYVEVVVTFEDEDGAVRAGSRAFTVTVAPDGTRTLARS